MYSEQEDNVGYLLQDNEATILKEGSTFHSIAGEDSSDYVNAEGKCTEETISGNAIHIKKPNSV